MAPAKSKKARRKTTGRLRSRKASLKREYEALKKPPTNATAAWFQKRGLKFESLLTKVLNAENLNPRISYRIDGEQIDGSLAWGSGFFLLEAKWQADPIPASSLYAFKGKVDGKLIGTLGIFISMSNYSKDAIDALMSGKALNLVLFDRADMDSAIGQREGFKKVLSFKLRAAAEQGLPFIPYTAALVTSTGISQTSPWPGSKK